MFDQVTLFMVFLMLCFAGIAAMFYFILRGLDELSRELKGERSQLIGLLQSMEASLDILVKVAQISVRGQAGNGQTASGKPAGQFANPVTSPIANSNFASPVSASIAPKASTSLAETRAAQNMAARAAAGHNVSYQDLAAPSLANQNLDYAEPGFEDGADNGIPSLTLSSRQNMETRETRRTAPGLSLKK